MSFSLRSPECQEVKVALGIITGGHTNIVPDYPGLFCPCAPMHRSLVLPPIIHSHMTAGHCHQLQQMLTPSACPTCIYGQTLVPDIRPRKRVFAKCETYSFWLPMLGFGMLRHLLWIWTGLGTLC